MTEHELVHMTVVLQPLDNEMAYYLPNHGVLKEDRFTTNLRVAFDGSMKKSSGYSFNDLQMVGPTIQQVLENVSINSC